MSLQEKLEYAIMQLLDNILTKEKQTMANRIVLNPVSYHGAGAVKEIGSELSRRGYKRAFIASGRHVVKSGEIKKIADGI